MRDDACRERMHLATSDVAAVMVFYGFGTNVRAATFDFDVRLLVFGLLFAWYGVGTYRSGSARPKIVVKLLFFTLFHYNFPKKSLLDVLKCIIGTSVKFYVDIAFQNIERVQTKHH